jgi:periplasmic divalent cation tolerance protein
VQEDGETALILKTRSDLVERITQRVKELHSYDCPCVVALPIAGGNPDFLQWIAEETR